MADHSPTGPVETGAQMDYPEHEKTYKTASSRSPKYVSLLCFALLVAMAFGSSPTQASSLASIMFFAIVGILGYALRDVPTHIT